MSSSGRWRPELHLPNGGVPVDPRLVGCHGFGRCLSRREAETLLAHKRSDELLTLYDSALPGWGPQATRADMAGTGLLMELTATKRQGSPRAYLV
jgi:hypothetical protein